MPTLATMFQMTSKVSKPDCLWVTFFQLLIWPAGLGSPLFPGPVSRSIPATCQQIVILVHIELHSIDVEYFFCIIKPSSLFLELQSVARQCITYCFGIEEFLTLLIILDLKTNLLLHFLRLPKFYVNLHPQSLYYVRVLWEQFG